MYIFRAWITRKDGTRDYAKDHGKRAFRIWIDPEALNQKKKKSVIKESRNIVNQLICFYFKENKKE